MRVTPVSAVPALRIRQKPVAEFIPNADLFDAPRTGFGAIDMPAHIAAAELERDLYAGGHAEYATQLLASRQLSLETELERRQHHAQYRMAADDSDDRSYTVSLSA
ncbi:hypothetical protein [Roseibium sediminicola]|uniref:Uncharacterized protein n=1 Tax=Roseibium sediminicola TaxID=2933272 RepID=A0ABT0GYP9_9HYPH|nr:hypothetical protein [Roseibium sp. CAU 1639]MCK7614355.1 hypothetical protein [Roseibium sp. CAU 1639]